MARSNNRRNNRNNRSSKPEKPLADQFRKDDHPFRADASAAKLKAMGDNDWRWYAQNEQLVKDYASLPFGVRLGTVLNTGSINMDHSAVPGVMAVYLTPTIGFAQSPSDSVNIAARNFYTFVRKNNSGATNNYEAADMMMYLLATTNVLAYVEFVKRAIGLMMDYTPLNSYYPRCLIQAMGLNWISMQKDLVTLRGYVNQLAVKANSLVIPATFPYVARQVWLYQNIWQDSNTDKAQTYFYTPHGFWTYPGDSGEPTSLVYKLFISKGAGEQASGLTVGDLIAFGNAMIDPILASQSFNIMSGDILKAYESNVVRITGVSDTYVVLPMISPEVQAQFENLVICGAPDYDNFTITQETDPKSPYAGCIYHEPVTNYYVNLPAVLNENEANTQFDILLNPLTSSKVLNFHHGGVKPEEVLVATRLSNIAEIKSVSQQTNGSWQATLLWPTAGSEMVATVRSFSYRDDDMGSGDYQFREIGFFSSVVSTIISTGITDLESQSYAKDDVIGILSDLLNDTLASIQAGTVQNGRRINHWSVFDWAPQIHNAYYVNGGITAIGEDPYRFYNSYVIPWCALDFDYYTVMDLTTLKHMSEAALLSEFGSPL